MNRLFDRSLSDIYEDMKLKDKHRRNRGQEIEDIMYGNFSYTLVKSVARRFALMQVDPTKVSDPLALIKEEDITDANIREVVQCKLQYALENYWDCVQKGLTSPLKVNDIVIIKNNPDEVKKRPNIMTTNCDMGKLPFHDIAILKSYQTDLIDPNGLIYPDNGRDKYVAYLRDVEAIIPWEFEIIQSAIREVNHMLRNTWKLL